MNGHVIKINKLTPPLTPLNDEAFVFCVYTICAMTSFNYYDQNPSGFFFLVRIKALVFFNLAGVIKFKYERKNEKDSGRSSKMTPSCKLPIVSTILTPTEILRSRGIILKQFYPLLFRFHHIALTELLWFIFRVILRPRLL